MNTQKKILWLVAFLVLSLTNLKAQELNYLSNNGGNQLVDAAGNEVRLTGVNWFGFETGTKFPHGLWARDMKSMLIQIKDLGFNSLRVPWSNEMLAPGATISVASYGSDPYTGRSPMNEVETTLSTPLELMDLFMEYCRELNLKVFLDNHSRAADAYLEENLWYTPTFSEAQWIADWVFIADRYKGNDAFIGCDINNEPHGSATWGNSNPATDWNKAAERCGNAILAANPDVLIIVEGIEFAGGLNNWWGGNLAAAGDFPVVLTKPEKLVYSMHEYGPEVFEAAWFNAPDFPNNMEALWGPKFDYLYTDNIAPLLAGEFGIKDRTAFGGVTEVWFDTWMAYMGGRYSWTFWSWNPNSGDTGGILEDDWTTVVDWKVNKLTPYMAPEIPNGSVGQGPGNRAPVAAATITPVSGAVPLDIVFDGAASTDPDGDTITYSWDFGDGTTSTSITGTHTYGAVGNYTVSLTVNDGQLNSIPFTQSVTVSDTVQVNNAPIASAAVTPSTGNAPLTVTFDGTGSIDPDGDAIDYSWDFGDGTTSTAKSGTHTYTSAGNYTVSLVVNDGQLNSLPATIVVTVTGSQNNACDFGAPLGTALPTISNSSYSHVHLLGTGGPDLSNVTTFTINWDLTNNGLWQFSMNTNNGTPSWWIDFLPLVTQSFNQPQPEITITGSGITNLDGSYYATRVGSDFALVSKTAGFTIYFSDDAVAPVCTQSREVAPVIKQVPLALSVYPNPSATGFTLNINDVSQVQSVKVLDQSGRAVFVPSLEAIAEDGQLKFGASFSKGLYFVVVSANGTQKAFKLIKS